MTHALPQMPPSPRRCRRCPRQPSLPPLLPPSHSGWLLLLPPLQL
jgi:hypothetical protein